ELGGDALREAQHERFGRGVGRHVRARREGAHRGDVHHHAGLARDHRGQTAAGQLDQHLDVEANLVELALDRQAVEAAGGPEARVVDEPVDGEPAARHLLDQLARRSGPQQVLHDDVSPHPMRVPELAREGLQPLGAPRERLARLNAFTSRRGRNTVAALAERRHLLTGGLRRQVPATYAFSQLWNEMVGARLGEEGEKRLEGLADQVNACLGERDAIVPGKEEDIDRALAAYRDALAAATGPEVARLDLRLKAVPEVAERLRRGTAPEPDEPAPA